MRWRSGEAVVGLVGAGLVGSSLSMGEFQSLSEVAETSILKLGLPALLRLFSQLVTVATGRRPYRLLRPPQRVVA